MMNWPGVICAWDRLEAHMAARKHAAVAEFIRRRPAAGCSLEGPARMPAMWDEFIADELRLILAESRGTTEDVLGLARDLEEKLPGTRAAFRDGICASPRRGSSRARPGCWTPGRRGPRRPWCLTGRGG